VFPELVVYDGDGQPLTVKYHVLSSILLNELKKAGARAAVQEERLRSLEARLALIEASAAERRPAPVPGRGSTARMGRPQQEGQNPRLAGEGHDLVAPAARAVHAQSR